MLQASSLETQAGFLCCVLEGGFLLWKTSVFTLKALPLLDEAHPLYGGHSALFSLLFKC